MFLASTQDVQHAHVDASSFSHDPVGRLSTRSPLRMPSCRERCKHGRWQAHHNLGILAILSGQDWQRFGFGAHQRRFVAQLDHVQIGVRSELAARENQRRRNLLCEARIVRGANRLAVWLGLGVFAKHDGEHCRVDLLLDVHTEEQEHT